MGSHSESRLTGGMGENEEGSRKKTPEKEDGAAANSYT
jgi:hypothetical protein